MTSMKSNNEDTCIGSSNSCPSSSLYSCNHNQDISIECSKTYNSNMLMLLSCSVIAYVTSQVNENDITTCVGVTNTTSKL